REGRHPGLVGVRGGTRRAACAAGGGAGGADGVRAVSARPHPRRSQLVPYEEAFEPRVGGECEGEWGVLVTRGSTHLDGSPAPPAPGCTAAHGPHPAQPC